MRKLFGFLLALAVSCPAMAADSTAYGGFLEYNKTSGVYTDMVVNGTLSAKKKVEAASTDDTLTAAESGKVILVTDLATFTLPTAADGLSYKFIDASDGSVFSVDPQIGDTIKYSTLVAGDKATSPGASADSIEVIGSDTNIWAVGSMKGTFTDGN